MGDRRINTLGQEDCCSGIRSTFDWLVDALRDVLQRQRTEMCAPVSVERRVAVALWWMASTMSYRTVAHQFGLARSTVAGIVVEVTRAITEALLDRVVYLRDPDKGFACDMVFKPPTHLKCEARTNLDAWNDNNGPMIQWLWSLPPRTVRRSLPPRTVRRSLVSGCVMPAHSSGGEQEESTREEASCEEQIPAPQEEVVLVPEEHPRVEISSGTEGEAVKRLNYRVGFIERSVKRMRQIMQRSQTTARRRRRQDHQPAHQPSGGQAEQEGPPTGPTV
ncbi:UNVERIFIED_CONTAM: hypothetical protein K2H54_050608 [Gekko kuhli]